MPTGRNADHLFGPNADQAECRPQQLILGRNADSNVSRNQTKLNELGL